MYNKIIYILLITGVLTACTKSSTPRPYGYFRINLATPEYHPLDSLGLPYQFERSGYSVITARYQEGEKYWIDLKYPHLNASLHCSYKSVHGNLLELSEDSRKYVYKHTVMADGIGETVFQNDEKRVYGILYDLKGNTASSIQFVLTDSSRHFFRGALYFDNVPNKDSIAPVVDYVRKDIVHLMETFEWK
jgi:gliding motility-associated lipoprotein GldD